VAAFRSALAAAVTEQTITAVVAKLTEAALAGDLAAIKLFLAYTIGKPTAAVNPDMMDVEELRQYEQEQLPPRTVGAIATGPSPQVFPETARMMRPLMDQQYWERLQGGIDERDADRQAAADGPRSEVDEPDEPGCPEVIAHPTANVGHPRKASGSARNGGRPSPSPNGIDGAGRPGGPRHPGPGRDGRGAGGWDDREDPGADERPLRQ
jgi:hypothetical protein